MDACAETQRARARAPGDWTGCAERAYSLEDCVCCACVNGDRGVCGERTASRVNYRYRPLLSCGLVACWPACWTGPPTRACDRSSAGSSAGVAPSRPSHPKGACSVRVVAPLLLLLLAPLVVAVAVVAVVAPAVAPVAGAGAPVAVVAARRRAGPPAGAALPPVPARGRAAPCRHTTAAAAAACMRGC